MTAQQAVDALLSSPAAPLGAVVGVNTPAGADIAVGGATGPAGSPVTRDTAFDIASVTKVAATTSAILRLVSLGLLRLDESASAILPDAPAAPGTTVRHLLLHRAGLWEWQPLYLADGTGPAGPTDPWETIRSLPLRYEPDSGRHYSDLGFMLLGRIIEVVSGLPLDGAFRTLVAEPLGLQRSGYGPADEPVAMSSHGDDVERKMVETGAPYPVVVAGAGAREPGSFPWRTGPLRGTVNDGNCFHAFRGVAGHAGLFSTADDLLRIGAALAAPEAHSSVWHPEVVAEFFRDGPDAGQALGWRSATVRCASEDQRMLWHPGFTGCALGVLPDAEAAVIMLTNRLTAGRPAKTETLWDTALPLLLGREARTTEGTRTP